MSIEEGFKYPFRKFKRLFYFYWIILPIIGWFWLCGYMLKIIQELVKGNNRELPPFGSYSENFQKGFFFFVYSLLISLIILIINIVPVIGHVLAIIFGLITPILTIQYTNKESFSDGLDIKKALILASNNIIEYIVAFFKTIVVFVILVIISLPIITLIVTIPAAQFFKFYFFADFYRNFAYKMSTRTKRKKTTKKRR